MLLTPSLETERLDSVRAWRRMASGTIKVGTKVRGIRLIDGVGDHDLDGKVDGFGQLQLKSGVVKKA